MRAAARLTITGVVQGVGFRPFVHRLAVQHELAGWVRNLSGQVEIHVEGEPSALRAFSSALPAQLPTLARIETLSSAVDDVDGADGFRIIASRDAPDARLPVPPDVVTCDACAAEVFDPASRRYRYPFTTCTDCGPRYTVIESLPYDRERTSLRAFPLCARCQQEYESPADRRFHAESTACPDCGPHLRYVAVNSVDNPITGDDQALRAAANALRAGEIVAVRGLGGFHLAVDATDELAVSRLRVRKRRDAKPLACMVRTVDDVRRWTAPTDIELEWITSRERPIVLLARRHGVEGADALTLAPGLAPGLDRVGLMLPSTPLHHLLLEMVDRPLVMTSGNLADEPLAAGNDEAMQRLLHIADGLLLHDREIVARIDDSVIRLAGASPIVIRRARGYAPLPLSIPVASPVPILAVGAHLKNTFTLVHGNQAFVSPHIGDLDSMEALSHWQAVRGRYQSLFRITPGAIVADLHDGYLSTRAAEEAATAAGLRTVLRVQHHHAHVAAVAAEHGVTDRVLGLAFDGTGAGTDGTVWGMEFLLADLLDFQRVAHLRPAPLPGGDAAVRAPWRALAGFLSLDRDAFASCALSTPPVTALEARVVQQQIDQSVNAPLASSAGRLFDAVASLLGVCQVARFEGEAAMQLEACAGYGPGVALPFPVVDCATSDGPVLDPVPLLVALCERQARGVSVQQLAADFHESLIRGSVALTTRLADTHQVYSVALGGGCFQNARLLTGMGRQIRAAGLSVLTARRLPANDGGVSFGQAAIAAARLANDAAGITAGFAPAFVGAEFDQRRALARAHGV
ncbi:MAG: carbamoyltransferase HypF [Gemmatimonadaceae bacterium]|nr:carbamoyltransferase HypF [Gemmatimonadaceae bacterium]